MEAIKIMYKEIPIIEFGRDCDDFEYGKREIHLAIPFILDSHGNPDGPTSKPFKVVDCMKRKSCSSYINYPVPTNLLSISSYKTCYGIIFSDDEIQMVKDKKIKLKGLVKKDKK